MRPRALRQPGEPTPPEALSLRGPLGRAAQVNRAAQARPRPEPETGDLAEADTRPVVMPDGPPIVRADRWGSGGAPARRVSLDAPSALDEVLRAAQGVDAPRTAPAGAPARTEGGRPSGAERRPQRPLPQVAPDVADAQTEPIAMVRPEPVAPQDAGESAPASSRRQLLSGTTWQLAAQFLPLILNLAITKYVILHMGDARWGLLMGVNVLTAFLSTLDGGIGQAAMRYFSIYAGNGDKQAATRLLVNLAAIIASLGALVFSGVFFFSDQVLYFNVPPDLRPEGVFLLRTMTVIVAIGMVRQLFASLLFSHNLFSTNTVGYLIGHLIYMAGLLGSIRYGWGLYGVAWAFVLQQTLATLLIVPRALRLMDLRGFTRMSWAEVKEFWRYAWKIQVAGLMTFFMFTKDQLVIGRIEPVAVVGYYGQGAQFAQQLRLLPSNALSPIQGILGRAHGSGDAQKAADEFAMLQRLWVRGVTGWCAVGIPAAYFGVSHWLPPSFAVSGTVAAVLLLGHMFAMWPAVLLLWCLTLGHSEVDLKYGITTMSINVVLTLAMIPAFGAIGTVYASTISLFCGMVALSIMAGRVLPFPVPGFLREVPWLHAWVAAILCFTPEFLLRLVMPSGAPALIAAGLIAVPAVLYYVLAVFGVSRLRAMLDRFRGGGSTDQDDLEGSETVPVR